jgi:hypothetical protein
MPRITFDLSGKGGLVDHYYGDKPYSSEKPELRILATDGQYAGGFANPFSKYGYLTPINNTKLVTTISPSGIVSASLTEFWTGRSGGTWNLDTYLGTYKSGNNDSVLHRINGQVATTSTTKTITVGTKYPKIIDIQSYMINGVATLFYIWHPENSSTGDIGITNKDFSTVNEVWLSTIPTNKFEITDTATQMILADNKSLYILDANAIHRLDGNESGGANGTIYKNVIVFMGTESSNTNLLSFLKDGIDYNSKLWIAIHVFRGQSTYPMTFTESAISGNDYCGVYVWDRRSTVASATDFIIVSGVRQILFIYEFQGIPYLFDISSDGYTELRAFNGSKFEIVKRLGKNAYPLFKDSVSVTPDVLTWLGADGTLYGYGKIEGSTNSLHKLGDFTTAVTATKTYSQSGCIALAHGYEANTAGYNDTPLGYYVNFTDTEGTSYVKKFFPHSFVVKTVSQYPHQGDVYTPVKLLTQQSKLDDIQLYYPAVSGSTGSTTVLTVKVYTNQGTTPIATFTLDQDDAARGYKTFSLGKRESSAVQLEFEWNTAIALKDTITPSYAIINYSN